MKEIKTLKGYLKVVELLHNTTPRDLKGWEKLSENEKEILEFLSCDISNSLGEYKQESKQNKQ